MKGVGGQLPPGMSLRPPPTTSSLVMVVRVFFTEALSVSLGRVKV